MDLLKAISKDKLIIMVTHNPDIAEKYSNRIVKLLDGKITDDSNPYTSDEEEKEGKEAKEIKEEKEGKNYKKTQMKFTTALHLSLNNLMTKKGRTILTAFAGSIGIIGIALILSLSSGVDNYITNIQKDTMVSYPLTIEDEGMDFSSMMSFGRVDDAKEVDHDSDAIYANSTAIESASSFTSSITKNNLTEFKKYLDSDDCEINQYLGENGIVYSYDTKFDVYTYDKDKTLINTDGSTFTEKSGETLTGEMTAMRSNFTGDTSYFSELLPGNDDELVSSAIKNEYEIVSGRFPEKYDEVVINVDKNNEITTTELYELGILPASEYKEILKKLNNSQKVELDTQKVSYEDMLNKEFYIIPECDYYVKNDKGLYEYVKENSGKVEKLLENATKLKVVGIIRQKEDSDNAIVSSTVCYTKALTDYIIKHTDESAVVKAQEADKETNVKNGLKFKIKSDSDKVEEAKKYLSSLGVSEKASIAATIIKEEYKDVPAIANSVISMSEIDLSNMLDEYLKSPANETLINIYDTYISPGSYEDNIKTFGKINKDAPSSIAIYTDSFESKDLIKECIDRYNDSAKEEDKIVYTDYVGLLMSSVTTIINAISYVLIAFVSISLVVSSIMIAIITYISVLERTKEIGILRAMGTSKKDVSKIFNAETFIEGLSAGVIGIGVTLLLNIPINFIIAALVDVQNISKLPVKGGVTLVIISVLLTVIAGLIPSKLAAKKDPAVVLRTE